MKQTLLTVSAMMFRTVLFTALVMGGAVLASSGEISDLGMLSASVIVGLSLSVWVTYQRAVVHPVKPGVLVPVTGLIVAGVLAATVLLLPAPGVHGDELRGTPATLREATILYGRSFSLFVTRWTGSSLRDTVLISHNEIPRLQSHLELHWNHADGELLVPGSEPRSTREMTGLEARPVPAVLSRIVIDVAAVHSTIDGFFSFHRRAIDPVRAGRLALLSLLLAFLWFPARMSRWPLINGVVTLAMLRLILAIPELTDQWRWVRPVAVGPVDLEPILVGWGGLALVVLVLGIVLPPFRRWQREMHFEEVAL